MELFEVTRRDERRDGLSIRALSDRRRPNTYRKVGSGGDRHLKFNEIRDNLDTRSTPEQVAGLVREHRGIESLHWLRDTVYREDDFTARTGSGPRVMAALRNLEVGAIHLIGRRDITETTKWATRLMDRSVKILAR